MTIFGFGNILKLSTFNEFLTEVEIFTNSKISFDRLILLEKSLKLDFNINPIMINNIGATFVKLSNGEIFRSIIYVEKQIVPRFFSPQEILIENLNRYHFYQCQNLSNLIQKGAELSATANFNGFFKYSFVNNSGSIVYKNQNQHLLACKNCISEFNKQYGTNYNVNNFRTDLITVSQNE